MEKILDWSRHIFWVPILGSLVMMLGLSVIGMIHIATEAQEILAAGDFSTKTIKLVTISAIESLDLFLVATAAYITAVGLYVLYINPNNQTLPMAKKITTLKKLKDKIIGVIVAALAVSFLGYVTKTDDLKSLIGIGVGIGIVIVALAIFMYLTELLEHSKKNGFATAKISPKEANEDTAKD